MQSYLARSVVSESIIVDEGHALVQWRDPSAEQRTISLLDYKYGRWWLTDDIFSSGEEADLQAGCPPSEAPTPQFLMTAGVDPALAALANAHTPLVQEAVRAVQAYEHDHLGGHYGCSTIGDRYYSPSVLPFQSTNPQTIVGAGYRVRVKLAQNNGDEKAGIADPQSRAPTEAESWANPPSGNAYYFFSGTVRATQPVHVQAGTIIDVWFPFVLDTSLSYSLTIAAPNAMSLGPVEGTLKDNTLHFVLPAFTAPPGAELMGEIEGN